MAIFVVVVVAAADVELLEDIQDAVSNSPSSGPSLYYSKIELHVLLSVLYPLKRPNPYSSDYYCLAVVVVAAGRKEITVVELA